MIDPEVAKFFGPVIGILFSVAAITAVIKIIRGPAILDRVVGTDVLLATIMCGLGGYIAFSGRHDLLVVLLVFSLFGFVGSVSVSRYVSRTPTSELTDFAGGTAHDAVDADEFDHSESPHHASARGADGKQVRL